MTFIHTFIALVFLLVSTQNLYAKDVVSFFDTYRTTKENVVGKTMVYTYKILVPVEGLGVNEEISTKMAEYLSESEDPQVLSYLLPYFAERDNAIFPARKMLEHQLISTQKLTDNNYFEVVEDKTNPSWLQPHWYRTGWKVSAMKITHIYNEVCNGDYYSVYEGIRLQCTFSHEFLGTQKVWKDISFGSFGGNFGCAGSTKSTEQVLLNTK